MNIEKGSGEVSTEPAKQSTINAVASGLKDLLGKSRLAKFPIGEDSGKTLEVVNQPVAPWCRDSEGLRIGRNMAVNVKKEEMFFTDKDTIETKTEITPFRLDTSKTKSPELRIATHEKDEYLASQISVYRGLLEAHKSLPEEKRWKPPTEEQAQGLRRIVEVLATEAKEGKKSKLELQEKFVTEFDRIIAKTGDALIDLGEGKEITLPLDDKAVRLVVDVEENARAVSILTPRVERIVSENYLIDDGMPIAYNTSSITLEGETEAPMGEANREELIIVSNTLSLLSDEVIENELATREIIRTAAETIVARKGNPEDGAVDFQLKNAKITVGRISNEDGPGILVQVNKFVEGTDLESKSKNDVAYQKFALSPGNPLEVMTFFYWGTTVPVATIATEQDKKDVIVLLKKLAKK